jgi:uridine kinase
MQRGAFVVVVSGCSGSGKTSLAEAVAARFVRGKCVSLDAFYRRDLGPEESWESPDSIAWDALLAELERCAALYRVVVLEGFCVLHDPRVAARADLVVRLECSREEAMRRRVARDGAADSEDPDNTSEYYERAVWPAHLEYARRTADVAAHVTVNAAALLAQSVNLVVGAIAEKQGS